MWEGVEGMIDLTAVNLRKASRAVTRHERDWDKAAAGGGAQPGGSSAPARSLIMAALIMAVQQHFCAYTVGPPHDGVGV